MNKFLYFLVIVFLISACTRSSDLITQDIDRIYGPDEIIDSLTIISSSKDEVEWIMTSALVKRYSVQKRWTAYDVFIESIEEENKNFYSSDSAFISEMDNIFTGMGNVVIISPNGILKTQKLTWNRLNNQIHAPEEVYLKRNDNEFFGRNLYTNINFDYVDLREVSGHGTIDEKMLSE